MMNCSQIHERTHKYLEDLLPEAERREARTHLEACEVCRDYAARQNHLSADLKRLYFSPSPFELVPVMEAALSLKNQTPKVSAPKKVVFLILLALTGFAVWQHRSFFGDFKPQRPAVPKPAPAAKRDVVNTAGKANHEKEASSLESLKVLSEVLQNPWVSQKIPAAAAEQKQASEPVKPEKKTVAYAGEACVDGDCSEFKITH